MFQILLLQMKVKVIVKSFEKDGKLVYILQIKGMICEMPMIEIDKQWNAIGMKCGG